VGRRMRRASQRRTGGGRDRVPRAPTSRRSGPSSTRPSKGGTTSTTSRPRNAVVCLCAHPPGPQVGRIDESVAAQLGVVGVTVLRVRPDRYIGLRNDSGDPRAVGAYLNWSRRASGRRSRLVGLDSPTACRGEDGAVREDVITRRGVTRGGARLPGCRPTKGRRGDLAGRRMVRGRDRTSTGSCGWRGCSITRRFRCNSGAHGPYLSPPQEEVAAARRATALLGLEVA
jgi:hypothetical protein